VREASFVDAFGLANPAASGFTDGQGVETARPTASERIDYVFLVPGQRVPGRVVRSRVVLHEPSDTGRVRWPSDHYGVLAEIALEGSAASHVAGGGTVRAGGRRRGAGS
jgi:endonuclease/exonuclease/phosphatase family metal-dependent hydrolase